MFSRKTGHKTFLFRRASKQSLCEIVVKIRPGVIVNDFLASIEGQRRRTYARSVPLKIRTCYLCTVVSYLRING